MAQNLLQLLEDPAYAKQLGAAGKQHILQHFSMQRHIDTLQDTLQKALKN
jgi:glycosyltransferase involved in cell wall biosynthesis